MKLLARITLEENIDSVLKRGFSGMRANFRVSGMGSVCQVTWPDELGWLEQGESRDVVVDLLPWAEEIKSYISPGTEFELMIGDMVLAKGIVKSVRNS